MKPKPTILKNYALALLGNLIYATSLNVIITPYQLYSGSTTGVAQIIRALLLEFFHLPIPSSMNLTGIILLILNVPLLVLAYRSLSKTFFKRTVFILIFQTIAISLIPIPQTPLLDDTLTGSIVGGIIAGFGAGLTLRAGSSAGGTDILGLYLTKKYPNFSVGRISMIVGAFVFSYCLIRFDLNTVVYSIIYTIIYSFAVDRTHYQNIKISAMIFTKNEEVMNCILQQLKRGATCWKGYGAYTRETSFIYMTVISKYEVSRLKRIVRETDPQAFIIFNDRMNVIGNFERRLLDD